MNARLEDFDLPLVRPLDTAGRTIDAREGLLVRVEEGGTTGIGEATPLPGWTEPLDRCRDSLAAAVDRLEADGSEAALAALEGLPAARHGLSLALLDLEARRAGEPLYRQLADASEVPESMPANATVGDGTVEETVEGARAAVAEGFGCVKVKVGARSPGVDAGRLRAVDEAIESGVDLRADANGAWTFEEARDVLESVRLEYVEQPLPPDDLDGHAQLRDVATVALDESLREHSPTEVVGAGAADVLILKPMVLGGIDRALSVARTAVEAGVDPVVTTTIDGVVARAAAVHLAAALDPGRACGLATARMLADDLAPDPAPVEDGRIAVPDGVGHGVAPDEAGEDATFEG